MSIRVFNFGNVRFEVLHGSLPKRVGGIDAVSDVNTFETAIERFVVLLARF